MCLQVREVLVAIYKMDPCSCPVAAFSPTGDTLVAGGDRSMGRGVQLFQVSAVPLHWISGEDARTVSKQGGLSTVTSKLEVEEQIARKLQEQAADRRIHIGGISGELEDEGVLREILTQFGEVEEIRIKHRTTTESVKKKKPTWAEVTMATDKGADMLMSATKFHVQRYTLSFKRFVNAEKHRSRTLGWIPTGDIAADHRQERRQRLARAAKMAMRNAQAIESKDSGGSQNLDACSFSVNYVACAYNARLKLFTRSGRQVFDIVTAAIKSHSPNNSPLAIQVRWVLV